jgi:hypothetical protein
MADAGRAGGTKRAGRTDADENGGRSIDDETHAVQRVAEGEAEELTPDSLAGVGAGGRKPQETSYAGTSTERPLHRGPTTGRKETNPEKGDARSGSTGSAEDAPRSSEPDSIGSTVPTKRADGSERRGSKG